MNSGGSVAASSVAANGILRHHSRIREEKELKTSATEHSRLLPMLQQHLREQQKEQDEEEGEEKEPCLVMDEQVDKNHRNDKESDDDSSNISGDSSSAKESSPQSKCSIKVVAAAPMTAAITAAVATMPPPIPPRSMRRSATTMSSVDIEIMEKQVAPAAAATIAAATSGGSDECDGFISQLDKDGNIEQVPVKYDGDGAAVVLPLAGQPATAALEGAENDDDEESSTTNNPISDFMSADILAKPFNFVSGSTSKSRFNPFRKKKSGLLSVLAKQATRNRLVGKSGAVNTQSATDGKTHHFFKDFFITLLDLSWRWIFMFFATGFLASWLLFAAVWYLTFFVHGDFEPRNRENSSFTPCVSSINDFTSCFLFSIETQHTIGYGTRATTEQCPFAVLVMCLQSIVGVIIQACMAGIIFAKFTVPRARGETIVFSKNAVVTMRNGALFILCRISDLRKYSLLEAHVRMIVIRKERTAEGEDIPFQQTDLECGSEVDGSNDRVLILWPVTVAHKIDADSPFYEMGPRELLSAQFEIIVTLEGVTEETGNTVQARTSYLPNEILWGHHFENEAVVYDKKAGIYSVLHGTINKTVVDLTPRCSAKQLASRREKRASSAMTTTSSSEEISPRLMATAAKAASATAPGGGGMAESKPPPLQKPKQ